MVVETAPREGTWDQLLIYPAKLTKMVIEGKAVIIGMASHHRKIYRILEEPEETGMPTS